MPYNPCNHQMEEPSVTIPLSQYTEMVKHIQLLEDQAEIDRMKHEMDSLEARRVEAVHRLFAAEEKLKEAGIE